MDSRLLICNIVIIDKVCHITVVYLPSWCDYRYIYLKKIKPAMTESCYLPEGNFNLTLDILDSKLLYTDSTDN